MAMYTQIALWLLFVNFSKVLDIDMYEARLVVL